jgi:hypothetical protein
MGPAIFYVFGAKFGSKEVMIFWSVEVNILSDLTPVFWDRRFFFY